MKFFKTFLSYAFAYLFVTFIQNRDINVEGARAEEITLDGYFQQVRKIEHIVSRQVLVDGRETSINTFFHLTGAENQVSDDVRTIKGRSDVEEFSRLLSVVVSCEYSESAYYLVKLLQYVDYEYLNRKKKNWESRFLSGPDIFIKPLNGILSSMVLTLAGLLKYTQHFASKYHEALTVLLSWFIYIADSVIKPDKNWSATEIIDRIDSIELINNQVEVYLIDSIVNNCRPFNGFDRFHASVVADFKTHQSGVGRVIKSYEDLITLFEKKCEWSRKLTYYKFLSTTYKTSQLFVLTPSSEHAETVFDLIYQQISSSVVKIKWFTIDEDLRAVYARYIINNADGIKPILKFERIVLQTITNIIIGYVSKTLYNVIYMHGDINENCSKTTIAVLDEYLRKFERQGQPSYLINNMSIIRAELLTVCFKLNASIENTSKIKRHADKLKQLALEIRIDADFENFKSFLLSLSETVICTKLHPSVSNAFWEKLYFVSTDISEYVIDFKYLHTHFILKSDHVCQQISDSLEYGLLPINIKIKICERLKAGSKNCAKTEQCYYKVEKLYIDFQEIVKKIILRVYGVNDFNWKKLMLLLFHAINYVKSFNCNSDASFLENLKTIQDRIHDYFNTGYLVNCLSKSNSSNQKQPRVIKRRGNPFNRSRREVLIKETVPLNDIDYLNAFFGTINKFVAQILANLNGIDEGLKLYWDGIRMNLTQVHRRYEDNLNDQLRDNYDYHRFLVRWILAVVYTKIKEITDRIVYFENSFSWTKDNIKELELNFEAFLKLPLYIDMPVKPFLDLFVDTLKTYNDKQNNNVILIQYSNVIQSELESLGVIQDPSNLKHTTLVLLFKELIKTIVFLTNTYQTYSKEIQDAAKHFGIDQNYLIMMFREWYVQLNNNG